MESSLVAQRLGGGLTEDGEDGRLKMGNLKSVADLFVCSAWLWAWTIGPAVLGGMEFRLGLNDTYMVTCLYSCPIVK